MDTATLTVTQISVFPAYMQLGWQQQRFWSKNGFTKPVCQKLPPPLFCQTNFLLTCAFSTAMKVARERKSSVLASNAVHHRIDSLTGIVTLFVIVGANVIENAAWLDPVGGLLISIMVLQAGLGNSKAAFLELIDQSLDDEIKSSIRKHAHRAIANVSEGHQAELRDITGTKSGPNYLVDLEMAVPGAWTVNDVKDLEDAIRTQVGGKVRGVKRIRVRFVSRDGDVNRKFDEFIPGSARASVSEESDQEEEHGNNHDHDHDHDHDHKHKH